MGYDFADDPAYQTDHRAETADHDSLRKLIAKRGRLEVQVSALTKQIVDLKKALGIPLGSDAAPKP